MDIDMLASDIYYLRGVDDVHVEDGDGRYTYYVDVTLDSANTKIEQAVTEMVEDHGGEVLGVDDAGRIVTFLIDAR
jgi:hypothetical protein